MTTVTMHPHNSSGSSLVSALSKLADIIEEENASLSDHCIMVHAGFTDRKNQALRELMAAQRLENLPGALSQCHALLHRLSDLLRTNTKLLKLHIGAVGELSDIIIGSLREAESDGTYSRYRQLQR